MKKKTDRKKLESKLEKLITQKLKAKYGNTCQITNKEDKRCGQFHLLPKGAYPNLKYRPENILYAGWFTAHYLWHHDYFKARDIILPLINKICGNDWENRLKKLSESLPKTTMYELEKLYEWWERYE